MADTLCLIIQNRHPRDLDKRYFELLYFARNSNALVNDVKSRCQLKTCKINLNTL